MAEPMYRRIAEDLHFKIRSGELAPGAQLPTEIDLREEYGASRNTIRDAVKWLIARSLVETRPGQGTFVVQRVNPFITTLNDDQSAVGGEGNIYVAEVQASDRRPRLSPPRVEVQPASRTVARALQIDVSAQVVSRHQQRFIDETPWSLQTTFYPMSLVQDGPASRLLEATDIPEGAVTFLAQKCGIRQVGYRDTIRVRAPDDNEARFFRLPGDSRVSVIDVHRVGFDDDGSRIRLTVTVYPADRNRLRINVGAVPLPREIEGAEDEDD